MRIRLPCGFIRVALSQDLVLEQALFASNGVGVVLVYMRVKHFSDVVLIDLFLPFYIIRAGLGLSYTYLGKALSSARYSSHR